MAKTKDLNTLIRLRRWQVDEKRRDLAILYGQANEIESRRQALGEELDQEQQAAAGEASFGFTYAVYGQRVIERREALVAELAAVEDEIEAAQARVADAYRELKSLEEVQESRDRTAAADLKRVEQAELDEIASQKHFRGGAI